MMKKTHLLMLALLAIPYPSFGCNLHPGQSHELYLRLLKRVEELKAASAAQPATSGESAEAPVKPAEKRSREQAPAAGAAPPAAEESLSPPVRSEGYFFSPFQK